MITTKNRIGYIRRLKDENGKEQFKYFEAKIKKVVIGKKKTSVYSDRFYALDAEELESNTEFFDMQKGLLLVNEPFITNNELADWCQRNVDYWNEHGARGIFDD